MKGMGSIEGPDLAAEVRPFLARTGMAPTMFCKAAIGDPGAWRKWTEGKHVTDRTAARVRAFIAAHGRPPLDREQKALLAAIAEVPPGEKLPLSRFARELNCSQSVLIDSIQALIDGGHLDMKTLRPPVARADAALPAASEEAGGATARAGQPADDAPPAQPSGEQLWAEIEDCIARTPDITPGRFALLLGRSDQSFRQIAFAARPKPSTVERVRAIIAGRREPFTPFERKPRSADQSFVTVTGPTVTDEEREAARRAAEHRLPGETLANAVRREAEEQGERRSTARVAGGGVTPLPGTGDLSRIPHSPRCRAVPAIDPGRWEALRALAEEMEEPLGAVIDRVIGAGILCVREDLREERLAA